MAPATFDLEIVLDRYSGDGDVANYGIALRISDPQSEADQRLGGSQPVRFVPAELCTRALDPAAYGEYLAGQLLAEPAVRTFFAQAIAAAQAQAAALRLRLVINPGAAELHGLRWETLRLAGSNAPLLTGQNFTFARYLDSLDWRPVRLRPAAELRALVVVADPADAARYRLAPVDRTAELAAARAGLGDIAVTELAARGQATLNNLAAALRAGCDILYLVAHGMLVDGEPWLFLEDAAGAAARIPGRELAACIQELADRPCLVVLASCQSAGAGAAAPAAAAAPLAALGPRLAEAGIPAVLAMQGDITLATAAAFMPVFFRELRRDGLVDRAAAVARGAVRDRPDWWMPVLFSRLKSGRIWGPADDPLFGLPPLPALDLPDKPYRYLDYYRREDAWVFFGRDREIRALYDRVTAADGPPVVLFYGQSGVGKSSLLAAGLLPRLEDSHQVRYARRDQAQGLLGTLAAALKSAPEADLAGAWRAAETAAGRPLLIILDQVEELFTRPNRQQPDEMVIFLAALASLFGDPGRRPAGRLILGFRKEWLAEIKERLSERALPCSEVFLERLGREGIIEIVTGPGRTPRLRDQYRLTVGDPLLPGQIADDLLADRESPVAPLLAILLAGMWEAARARSYDQPVFDENLYHEFRSRGLKLDDFLGRQLKALGNALPEVVDSGLALDLLAYHTTPLGTAEQRTLADLEQTYSHRRDVLPGLVQQCQDLYLLVDPARNQPGQPPASRLTHDTLAPHVRKRFDESDAPGQRARRILESRAVDWANGSEGPTLDDPDLTVVQSGMAGMRVWRPYEIRLVAASQRDVAQAKVKEAEAERSRQRSRLFGGGLALALLVIALVGYFALTAQTERNKAQSAATAEARARETSDANAREANTQKAAAETAQAQAVDARATAEAAAIGETVQRAKAEAARVALSAVDQLAVDKERALLLAVYAARQDASMFTDGALRKALASPGHTVWFTATLPTEPVWSHSGRELLMRTAENAIYIRDMETGSQSLISSIQSSPLGRMAWSPDDAHFLIEVGPEVQVWSTSERRPVAAAQGEVALTKSPWNRDGSKILLRAQEDLSIWDWRADQIIAIDAGRWSDIAWSGDSNHLYTFSDGVLQVWQASDGAQRFLAPELAQAGDALWSPEDSRLLVIGSDGRLRVWNAADETTIELATAETPLPTPDPDPVIIVDYDDPDPGDWRNHVAWSPDGARILTAKERVQVWNADDGALVTELLDHPDSTLKAHWNPDGTRVLIDDGQRVRVVNVTDNNRETVLLGQVKGIDTGYNAVAQPWSPDGRNVMTVAHNRVQVWDADTGAEIASLSSEPGIDLEHVVWSPTNDYVLGVNTTGQVRVWGLDPILKPTTINDQGFESWSPDGRYLVTSGGSAADQSVQVWDTRSETTVAHLVASGHSEEISPGMYHTFPVAGWNHDGSRLVIYPTYNVAQILTTTDWQPHVDLKGHAGQLTDAAWAPPGATGDRLATASADGTVRIWNATTGETVHVLRGHMGAINDIDWSPDGAYIASAGTDGTVRIWHVDTGEQARVLTGHTGSVEQVHWNPQPGSPLLVSVRQYDAKDDHTRIWNAETGEQVVALVGDGSDVREAYWNATGAYLAAITDDFKVFLWQPGDWRLLPEADGDAAAWSPDGAYLAADKPDNSIIVWDAAAKAVVRQFIGHTGDVNTIDWDRSDGKRFISRGADGKVRHWSLDDPRATAVIDTDAGDNYAGAILSPDGRYVALWSGSAGVSVYLVQIQDLITIACRAAVRNLGPIDWQEFIAPQNPQAICEDKPIPGTDYPDPRAKTTKG